MRKLTTEEFIKRAIEIYGDKYDYSECIYRHSLEKVVVKCPTHGSFKIKPSNHINNRQGCWYCGNESTGEKQRRPIEFILKKIQEKPNSEMYDFSLIKKFRNDRDDLVPVTCSKHGYYERTLRDILRSRFFGCRKCKIADDTLTKETFVERSVAVHGDKYTYEKTEYTKSHDPVTITCRKHGDFTVAPYIHVAGGGFCPKCTIFVSSYETELSEYLKGEASGLTVETTVRGLKGIKELDILIKEKNLAIEFDGLYWHSDLFKKKSHHVLKTKRASELGIDLVHIFEDEWVEKKEICKSILKSKIGITSNKIHARKCKIKSVSPTEAKKFLESNHIQGFCPSKHRYGLYDDESLVALMTFGCNRVCLGSKPKKSEYELLRFCNLKHTSVIGGASRLFKHFVHTHAPNKITSYCDIRWGSGKLYEVLNFKRLKDTPPNYFYVKGGRRFGRFRFRKDALVAKGHDPNKTERQIMSEMGYIRIYDCGSMKFEWTNKAKK